jgi:protein-disulfide isomerase-like protein with CxxC motif
MSKDYINDPDFISDLAVAQLSFMVANTVAVVAAAVDERHGHETIEAQRIHYEKGVRRIVRNMVAEMSVLAGDDAAMDRVVAMGQKIAEERALADGAGGTL